MGSRAAAGGTAGTAAGLMYERHAARIHGFCVRRLGDQDDAADAVQDTFLRAWLALRDGAEIRHPLPWLLTIADNVCVSRFRARRARVVTTELSERTGVDFPEAVGDVAGLAAALRALPDRQRRALLRRELQGYSYDEIGAELGASRASVAALLHRARLAVANTLRDARRGVAALVPIPAFLRAPFESASVAGVAVAGTAVVAVAQLAGPSPFSPSPPARSAGEIPAAVGAGYVVASTVRARPVAGRVAEAATDIGRRRPRDTGAAAPWMVVLARTGPASFHLPEARPQPFATEEPAAGPPTPEEPGAAPIADPQAPAPEAEEEQTEQADEPAPSPGRREPGAATTPPGKQPKGSKGRSAAAPGHAGKPETSHRPGAPGGGSSDAEQAPAEHTQPPLQASGEGAPGHADPHDGGARAPDEPGHPGGGQQGGGQGQGGGEGKGGGQEKGADEENGSKRNSSNQGQGGGPPGGRAP